MPGPNEFPSQPIFAEAIWIADRQLIATPPGYTKEPTAAPAALVTMHSGRTLIQVPHLDSGQAEAHGAYYRFRFSQSAYDEDDWYTLLAIAKGPQPVYLIDYDVEPESFVVGPELASFTLPRPTALSIFPGFAAAGLSSRAFLDGVELDETSSAPGAGEFRLAGSTLEIATATAGQRLDVRYYPAFQVAAEAIPARTVAGYQDVSAEVVLVEARS